jgi:hypothetical protein
MDGTVKEQSAKNKLAYLRYSVAVWQAKEQENQLIGWE